MTTIGCKDDLDTFHCFDCRFRDDTIACLNYRLSWNLTDLEFASDEDAEYAAGLVEK